MERESNQQQESNAGDIAADDDFGKTEFAAESAAMPTDIAQVDPETAVTQHAAFGWLGLILAIASLFFWPAILGPAGAMIGFLAISQGSRALGIWSIVLGAISFISYILLAPLYG